MRSKSAISRTPDGIEHDFSYHVFLSHNWRDRALVRTVAERLRTVGLHVWFDEWEIRPGDSIAAKIEEGLERSRVLVLCMSANAFGEDRTHLESSAFRFRDPLNKDRRFIPLRLDNAPIKGSLAQFLHVDWQSEQRAQAYAKLLAACRPAGEPAAREAQTGSERTSEKTIQLDYPVKTDRVTRTGE